MGMYADDNQEQLCSSLVFLPLARAPPENMLGQNVTHGHCAAGQATVLPELQD